MFNTTFCCLFEMASTNTSQKSINKTSTTVRSSTAESPRTALLSEYYGVCRICLDEAHESKLISPCRCRGSHKYVHKRCLQQWFESARKPICEICKKEYQKRPIGIKPFNEWKRPQPLSEEFDDRIDFYAGIIWMLFAARVAYMFYSIGTDAAMKHLTAVLGRGHLRTFWFVTYFFNTLYYAQICSNILQIWWRDQQIYEWDFMTL